MKATGSSQAISATREYDAFGNVTSSTGTHTGRFGYGGPYGYQEDEGGLKQLGHRLYDPVCGRFVTKDPIKDGRNWYAYCDNNPLKWCDPTGLGNNGGKVKNKLKPGDIADVYVGWWDEKQGEVVWHKLNPGESSEKYTDDADYIAIVVFGQLLVVVKIPGHTTTTFEVDDDGDPMIVCKGPGALIADPQQIAPGEKDSGGASYKDIIKNLPGAMPLPRKPRSKNH